MQQADLSGLLRTLLIILLVYYTFKFFARLFAPYLMKKMVNKMQNNAQQFQQKQSSSVREGETIIDRKPNTQKQSNKDVGEYVDFEEID